MTDDDLIRRGDALEAVAAAMWARDLNGFQRRLRALPAAAPRPMGEAPQRWDVIEARPGFWGVDYEPDRNGEWVRWDDVAYLFPHPETPHEP